MQLNTFNSSYSIFFFRRLSFLMSSGLSLYESIISISNHTKGNKKKELLALTQSVSEGKLLSSIFQESGLLSNPFSYYLIVSGEMSGSIPESLIKIAHILERKKEMKGKLISALIYPICIALFSVLLVVGLMIFIVPHIMSVLQSLNVPLPIGTKILLFLSHIIFSYGIFALLFLIFLTATILYMWQNNLKFKWSIYYLFSYIPVINYLVTCYSMDIIWTLIGNLLGAGFTFQESLSLLSSSFPNPLYTEALTDIASGLEIGRDTTEMVSKYPNLFPDTVVEVISAGEISGRIPESCLLLAEFYKKEFEDKSKFLSNLLEPAIMIVLGLFVGFVGISLITPIYTLTQFVGNSSSM